MVVPWTVKSPLIVTAPEVDKSPVAASIVNLALPTVTSPSTSSVPEALISLAETPANVEAPLTSSVPVISVLPAETVSKVEAPATLNVPEALTLPAETPANVEAPLTDNVPEAAKLVKLPAAAVVPPIAIPSMLPPESVALEDDKVTPAISPPVISTLLAFCCAMSPSVPLKLRASSIAACTNAVEAACVFEVVASTTVGTLNERAVSASTEAPTVIVPLSV